MSLAQGDPAWCWAELRPVSLLKAAILAATNPFLLVLPASQIPEWDFAVPGAPSWHQVLLSAGCVCHSSGHIAGLLHLRQPQTLQQEAADPPCGHSIPAILIPGLSGGM